MGSYTRFEHICITIPSVRIELIEHVVEVVRQPIATTHTQSAVSDSAKAEDGKHTRPIFSPPLLVGTPHQHRAAAWAAPQVLSRPLLSLRLGGIRVTKWRCSDRSVDDSLLAWLQARFDLLSSVDVSQTSLTFVCLSQELFACRAVPHIYS
jgi:hypothetical protein